MNKTMYFHRSAIINAIDEANNFAPFETGGVLLGYFEKPENIPVVLIATNSGPDAIHEKHHYLPDQNYDEFLIAEIYKKSNRTITYVGDWHTHPAPSTRMSYRDKKTLRRIASYEPARVTTPIMLILSLVDEWIPNVWQGEFEKTILFRKKLKIEKLIVKYFE